MTLTLLAVSLNDKPLSQPITAHFGPEGGTIGRADHNTMALPDPERHISRLQAEIIASGENFQIRNVGAANPIVVAGRSLAAGESIGLRHGNEVRIGGYQLKVVDDLSSERTGDGITRGRAAIAAQAAQPARVAETPRSQRPSSFEISPETPQPLPDSNPFADLMRPGPVTAAHRAPSAQPTASDPFADLLGPGPATTPYKPGPVRVSADDPFADLMPPPAGVSAGSAASVPAPKPATRLPDDFDPMAQVAAPVPARQAVPAASDDPFADLMPASAPSSSIDQLFGLGSAPGADPLAAFMAGAPGSAPGGEPLPAGLSTDPMAMFGEPSTAPVSAAPTASNHGPALQDAIALPRPIVKPPAQASSPAPFDGDVTSLPPPRVPAPAPAVPKAAPVAPRAAAPAPAEVAAPMPSPAPIPVPSNNVFGPWYEKTGELDRPQGGRAAAPLDGDAANDREALWQAFCAGAGIKLDLPGGVSPEMMNILGQIMINALGGTMRLMAVRANVKQEMRAHMTVIQARSNNPLKFSPDAKAGLEQLLKPPLRGFLPGPEAMTDAMHDLVGHSIGTVVGMRAALEGVLGRFEPEALEAKLASKSLLDAVLPMQRKARLWELYLQHFEGIRAEAQDDFQALFGKAFLAAYEQQLDRLHEESAASSSR